MRTLIVWTAALCVASCANAGSSASQPGPQRGQPPVQPQGEPITITQVIDQPPPPPGRNMVRRQYARLGSTLKLPIDRALFVQGARLRLELFGSGQGTPLTVDAVVQWVEQRDTGVSVIANREGAPGRVFLTVRKNAFAANIRLPREGDVTIEQSGPERLLITQFSREPQTQCLATARPVSFAAKANPDRTSQIDVGVVYTSEAACGTHNPAGCPDGEDALMATMENLASEMRQILACSHVKARINIVANQLVDFPESGNPSGDLSALNDQTTATGQSVLAFRIKNSADLVVGVVSTTNSDLGFAQIFTGTPASFKDLATAVVVKDQAFVNYVFTHELAHTMGAGHQPGQGSGRFDYSHDKEIAGSSATFFTVMAVGGNTLRIPFFSGPGVDIGGGLSTGDATHDNVRTLNNTRALVEGFRPGNRPPLNAIPCTQ